MKPTKQLANLAGVCKNADAFNIDKFSTATL
jgi:hypothetical protein